uniref:NADH dehydrogenase [ubiquinone] 1 alpha subcomplex subunit 1 n=1 Tax=Neurospora crassa TaxID=5141 RepID=Q6MFL8_NEUCS|nr:putative protein [Neurospora crassa]
MQPPSFQLLRVQAGWWGGWSLLHWKHPRRPKASISTADFHFPFFERLRHPRPVSANSSRWTLHGICHPHHQTWDLYPGHCNCLAADCHNREATTSRKTAAMPVPFEALIPYAIIVTMFGVTGAGLSAIKTAQNGGKKARWSLDTWDR